MEFLKAENIVKSFAKQVALNNVSISVREKSIFGLLGPNGAGKTTLIRIINQITAPDEGSVFFMGRKLKPSDIQHIGYLPEERGLYKKMKVGEQALYLGQLKGLSKKQTKDKLKYWFKKFDMLSWWDKKVEELSKGMQQKVQFITTILHEPKLLIFDEPFSGFDPINANLLKNEILELREKGATVIFSTHNMGSVEELCDDITLINKAESILHGQIDKIRENYKAGIYKIGYKGEFGKLENILNGRFQVLEHEKEGAINTARVKIPDKTEDNELLNLLIPHFHIQHYQEELPGMNEIFIKVVQESNQYNQ
ncbi:MAG: ABC transporter ATP-binding protein [Bacteroidales bacterium]